VAPDHGAQSTGPQIDRLFLLQGPVMLAGCVVDVSMENTPGDAPLNLCGTAAAVDVRYSECPVRLRVEADGVILQLGVGKRQHVDMDCDRYIFFRWSGFRRSLRQYPLPSVLSVKRALGHCDPPRAVTLRTTSCICIVGLPQPFMASTSTHDHCLALVARA
jgi:hypothetical protein